MYRKAVLLGGLLAIANSSYSQDSLNLQCEGGYIMTMDYIEWQNVQNTIFVRIDLKNLSATIDGLWGCIADIASPSNYDECNNPYTVSISSSEIEHLTQTDGNGYLGSSSFNINRFTGIMEVIGLVTDQQGNREFTVFDSVGEYTCESVNRAF